MTFAEGILVFDTIQPLKPGWFDMEAENANLGVPVCCGLPVVQESRDGIKKVYCLNCSRTITDLGSQWFISNWGKGIKIFSLPSDPALLEEFAEIRRRIPDVPEQK